MLPKVFMKVGKSFGKVCDLKGVKVVDSVGELSDNVTDYETVPSTVRVVIFKFAETIKGVNELAGFNFWNRFLDQL
jgi:hypothetical protein